MTSEGQKSNYERYRQTALNADFQTIMSQYPHYTNTPRATATIENMEYWHNQIEGTKVCIYA